MAYIITLTLSVHVWSVHGKWMWFIRGFFFFAFLRLSKSTYTLLLIMERPSMSRALHGTVIKSVATEGARPSSNQRAAASEWKQNLYPLQSLMKCSAPPGRTEQHTWEHDMGISILNTPVIKNYTTVYRDQVVFWFLDDFSDMKDGLCHHVQRTIRSLIC